MSNKENTQTSEAIFRNLPSMDMTNPENIKSAVKADAPSDGVSGRYICTIVQASLEQARNGSIFLTLAFQMPNGKIYRQDPKQIMKADGTDGYYAPKLRTLFGITRAKDTIGTTTIKGGDFIDGAFVERDIEVPSYVDLIGKQVGVVLFFYQKYPDSLGINGYTGKPIPNKQEDPAGYEAVKNEATTIWMPNYSKEPQPTFEFKLFFDPVTEKSFSEMLDDNLTEPKAVAEALEKVMKKPHKAVRLSNKDWDKLRVELLKRNLKKVGLTFDKDLFQATESNDSELTNDADLI